MLTKFLFNDNHKTQSAYIWNMSSSMLNAFMTVIILMVISRIDPVKDAGVFTIAFAIANLMLTIGNYGVRQFQVSDVQEKYKFREYLFLRVFTCALMIVVSVCYVGYYKVTGLYDLEKCIVIVLICLERMIDSFEEVFLGFLHQCGRLDVAGKVLTIRLTLYITTYVISYSITHNLILTSLIALLVSCLCFCCVSLHAYRIFVASREITKEKVRSKQKFNIMLVRECFPLFISAYLVMYVSNAPKYAIDKILSSAEQANFTYIFMPVFVIGVMSQFVYQPIIGQLSVFWNQNKMIELKKLILRQLCIILFLAVVAIVGGGLLGIPVLSILYGVNLTQYRTHLVVLLIGGTFLACIYFFQMLLTVMRIQRYSVWGYVVAYVAFVLFGAYFVEHYGLLGISLFYTGLMVGIATAFAGMVLFMIRKRENIES